MNCSNLRRANRIELFRHLQSRQCMVRNVHAKVSDVLIASAVRTPVGRFMGNFKTLPATRLGAAAIEMAVKQAAVPYEEVQEVYMGSAIAAGVGQAPARQAALWAGLHNQVCCTTVQKSSSSGLKAIQLAAQSLQLGYADVVVAGGMESMSNVPYYLPRGTTPCGGVELQDGISTDDHTGTAVKTVQRSDISADVQAEYVKTSFDRCITAWADGEYDAEVISVRVQQKGRPPQLLVTEDESLKSVQSRYSNDVSGENSEMHLADGAAALVLTNRAAAQRLQLSPLARIIAYKDVGLDIFDFIILSNSCTITGLLAQADVAPANVSLWEVHDANPNVPLTLIKHLGVNKSCVNAHGGITSMGHPMAMSSARAVTHLTHALKRGELGCAIVHNEAGGTSALLLEKFASTATTTQVPLITLYTKDPCPLCDILVEQLEADFAGQYQLNKVNITEKENLRFQRLYRYDIPVVFLNGQFLCMHKLNARLLRRRLQMNK